LTADSCRIQGGLFEREAPDAVAAVGFGSI